MIALRVKIEKVGDVNVWQAELVFFSTVIGFACLVVIDLDALHFESRHPMRKFPVKLGFHVNGIDSLDVLSDQRGDLFTCVICVALLRFVEMSP